MNEDFPIHFRGDTDPYRCMCLGNFNEAFRLASAALKDSPKDPLLLLEMGVIQVYNYM